MVSILKFQKNKSENMLVINLKFIFILYLYTINKNNTILILLTPFQITKIYIDKIFLFRT